MAPEQATETEDDLTIIVPPSGEPAKAAEVEPKQPDKVAAPEKPKAPAEDLAEQFKVAQAGHERERERATRAEKQVAEGRQVAARLAQERDSFRHGMATREMETIAAGLNAAETEGSAAEAEFQSAFDAGDSKRMAEAQRRMSRAEARKLRFDEAKYELESRHAEAEPQARERPAPPAQPADQFETYLGQFTPRTAGWLREHSEWVNDGKKNARLQAAHYDAVANDIAPDSDEYFSHVEQMIGLHEAEPPAKTNGAGNGAKPVARRGPPAAPPVSGARSGGAISGNEVRLSKVEASAATDGTHVWQSHDLRAGRIKDKGLLGQPIGHQEFARRKLEMTKQGAYDRSYTEQ